MNRPLLAIPIALAACSLTPSQLATDVQLIETGIQIIAPVLLAKQGISAVDVATINRDLSTITSAGDAIVKATTTDAALSARTLVAAVQSLEPIAQTYLSAGSQEAVAVHAAVTLLPFVLQAAGVPVTMMAARVQTMTPAEARALLAGMHR